MKKLPPEVEAVTNVFPGIAWIPEGSLQIVVGRLLCRAVRDMLESEVFGGRPIRWREGTGWLEHAFEIRGPIAHLEQIRERLQAWQETLGD